MDLQQMETFVLLVQHRSFSRVAKELGVSQPMVTIRIKKLEEELGIALIVRVSHKVKITPAGQVFYDHIERSMRVIRHGIARIAQSEPLSRQLSIATTPNISKYLLPNLLTEYVLHHPEWAINVETGYSSDVIEKVMDDVADIGFINRKFYHPEMIQIPLYKDPFFVIAHESHPLADKANLTAHDLQDELFYTYRSESSMYFKIMYLLREIGIFWKPVIEVRDPEVLKRMIMAGSGVAFLPWTVVKKEVARGVLVVLPVDVPRPIERNVCMIYKKENVASPPIADFLQLVDNIHFVKM